ncbi:MAG TPA: hypothetical protein VJJ76_03315 [archaeon]|nr:hypothetical protein [archaeon]
MTLKQSEKDELIEELLDAVAEQVSDLLASSSSVKIRGINSYTDKYLDNIIEIKQRISALETKTEKRLEDFEIIVNDLEKQLNEKFHSVHNESEQEYFRLTDQIANLRAAAIKLSNEIKEIKIQLALRRT